MSNAKDDILICSFYTVGTPYEQEAQKLIRSLDQFGLRHDVLGVPDKKSWDLNTKWKPFVIKRCMNINDVSVLYVDADATFHAVPDWKIFSGDVAFHVMDKAFWNQNTSKRKFSLMSGTLFFSNTDSARDILNAWFIENEYEPQKWDQHNLEKVIGLDPQTGYVDTVARTGILRGSGLDVQFLPVQYCAIDKTMHGVDDAVIRHHQASRRLKRKIG